MVILSSPVFVFFVRVTVPSPMLGVVTNMARFSSNVRSKLCLLASLSTSAREFMNFRSSNKLASEDADKQFGIGLDEAACFSDIFRTSYIFKICSA